MKTLLVAALFSVLSAPAFARAPGPYLVKSSGSGFMAPEWSRGEKCELYADKVVITKTYGVGLSLVETRAIALDGNVTSIIDAASGEATTETPNFLCDGPSTGVYANHILPNDAPESVTLFSTGGCGSPTIARNGKASNALRDIADTFCPLTYKGASND